MTVFTQEMEDIARLERFKKMLEVQCEGRLQFTNGEIVVKGENGTGKIFFNGVEISLAQARLAWLESFPR